MLRRVCVVAVVAAVLVSAAELIACGDKFLRVGRSARFHRYAAVHPTSILIYAPAWTPTGVRDFETLLKKAGHKPLTVTDGAGMSRAFTAGKYDVVIASYADAGKIREEVEAVPSKPALLPVLYKPTKTIETEAAKAYGCLIRPDKMDKFQALEEIDHLLGIRLKGITGASVTR